MRRKASVLRRIIIEIHQVKEERDMTRKISIWLLIAVLIFGSIAGCQPSELDEGDIGSKVERLEDSSQSEDSSKSGQNSSQKEDSSKPGKNDSSKPEESSRQEESSKPDNSSNREESSKPGQDSSKPNDSIHQEQSSKPEESSKPGQNSSKLEESSKPDESSRLEESSKPQGHKHSYSSTVTAPTCTAGGYTTYTCSCGDSYTGNRKSALGHNYKVTDHKDAAVGVAGYDKYTCSRCGSSYSKTIAALPKPQESSKPEESSRPEEFKPPVHKHSYSSVVTAPTCTAGGYTTYTCSCGDTYTGDETDAIDHDYETWDEEVKTTMVEGFVCNCGEHFWGDNAGWEVRDHQTEVLQAAEDQYGFGSPEWEATLEMHSSYANDYKWLPNQYGTMVEGILTHKVCKVCGQDDTPYYIVTG